MPDDAPKLTPAARDDVTQTLAFALTLNGRKRFQPNSELMAKITAEHLAQHLERCGFVIMRKPPGAGHSTSGGVPVVAQ